MKSISRQLTAVFVLVTAAAFFLGWLLTTVFLEPFYIYNQEKKLTEMYDLINSAAVDNHFNDDSFMRQLQAECAESNMDVLVVDVDSQAVLCVGTNPELTKMILWDNLFLRKNMVGEEIVLKETEHYKIKIVYDSRMGNKNIVMLGDLNNKNLFLVRTPLESIQNNVSITSQFLVKLGVVTVTIFAFIIWLITKKMIKPIMDLVRISNRISKLDFEARYEGKGMNEIAVLGENINSMSFTLKETISELKEVNLELERDIQRKSQAETMRNEFLSNVSHELKTPIALIQGYAEGLQEGFLEDEESRKYYCNVICEEATKVNQIVQKLLNLNQLEFGQNMIEMERFDITVMIRNQLQLSSVLLEQGGIVVKFNGNEPVFVWGDSSLITEVFNNYLSNAIHYCEREKIIDIHVERIDAHARIHVFNTGNCIPEDSIPFLWDKFYKVDKARTRSYGGNGVGLSIVKAIMESMGQKYGIHNYENGVDFWFELDLK